jgi:hypothetical protein
MQREVCIFNVSNAQGLAVYKILFSSEIQASVEDIQS